MTKGSVATAKALTLLKKQPPSASILIAALQPPAKAKQASKHAWLSEEPGTEPITSPWTSTPGMNTPHGVADAAQREN